MRTVTHCASLLLAATACFAGSPTGANAQSASPRVAVPSDGGSVDGCWTADRHLYGPYRLTFCLQRHGAGTYTVRGGGLYCNARLHWGPVWGGGTSVTLSRANCGRGTDWTADTLTCRTRPVWNDDERSSLGRSPRVAVPTPTPGTLDCRYVPAAYGYRPTNFTASRD